MVLKGWRGTAMALVLSTGFLAQGSTVAQAQSLDPAAPEAGTLEETQPLLPQMRDVFFRLEASERLAMQARLALGGFYAAEVDGLWGAGTAAAVERATNALRARGIVYDIGSSAGASDLTAFLLSEAGASFMQTAGEQSPASAEATFAEGDGAEEGEGAECDGCASADTMTEVPAAPALQDVLGAITLLNVNLTMSPSEVLARFEAQGMTCHRDELQQGDRIRCTDARGREVSWRCSGRCNLDGTGGSTLVKLSFSCEFFDACRYLPEQVAEFMVRDGLVNFMEPRQNIAGYGYCGTGPAGDIVCASSISYLVDNIALELGTLGALRPSFD